MYCALENDAFRLLSHTALENSRGQVGFAESRFARDPSPMQRPALRAGYAQEGRPAGAEPVARRQATHRAP